MLNLLPGLIKKSGVLSWAPSTWACVHSFGHKPRHNNSKKQCYHIHHQLQPGFFRIQDPTQKISYPKIQSPLITCWGEGDPSRSQRRTGMCCPISRSHFPSTGGGGNEASMTISCHPRKPSK